MPRGVSYSLAAQNLSKSCPIHRPCPAPSSARRGAKTVSGFRTRRTSAAQSSPQFSVPCQPHCGSAVAPPRLPSPAAILAGLAECQPAEYARSSRRATEFLRTTLFSRALGNPVKTRQRILTISLLRRGARMGFEPSFLTFFRAPCAIHLYSAHTEIVESLL